MKKNISYLLAFIGVILAACNPLKDEINNLKPVLGDRTIALTLAVADYELLPADNYAKKGGYFSNVTDANNSISAILNTKYPQFGDGTKANVVYNSLPPAIKPTDSVFTNVQYTVSQSDYTDGSAVVGNGNFKTYNTAQVLSFLEWKYPKATTPVNKQVLLTYQYFQSNVTTSAGVLVTEAFLLLPVGWQKIYLVSPAQYATLGRGLNNGLTSADVANFTSYFNSLLKADLNVIAPNTGEVRYISFKYIQSSSISYQRIYRLVFDGVNWGVKPVPVNPLSFLRKKGTWIPDPTVYYTLVNSDYAKIADDAPSTIGNAENRANLKRFNNFNVVAGQATSWTNADVDASLIFILGLKYPNAEVDPTVFYNLKYVAYTGSTGTFEKKFAKTAAGFVFVPADN